MEDLLGMQTYHSPSSRSLSLCLETIAHTCRCVRRHMQRWCIKTIKTIKVERYNAPVLVCLGKYKRLFSTEIEWKWAWPFTCKWGGGGGVFESGIMELGVTKKTTRYQRSLSCWGRKGIFEGLTPKNQGSGRDQGASTLIYTPTLILECWIYLMEDSLGMQTCHSHVLVSESGSRGSPRGGG